MNPRLFPTCLAILGLALAAGFVAKATPAFEVQLFLAHGLLSCVAVYVGFQGTSAGDGGGQGYVDALRAAMRGRRPKIPAGAPEDLGTMLEEVEEIARQSKTLEADAAKSAREVENAERERDEAKRQLEE